MQQHAYAQAVLAPVENYVVNRAVGGIIANRIAAARGVAANDAAWLATAVNDPVYKATMMGVSRTMTTANVASTVLGVGLAVAGAPVWLTIAASLGVLAVGAALVAGNTKIEVITNGAINQLRVTQPSIAITPQPYSTGLADIGSMKLGSQVYRDASCFTSETICMYFPLLPSNVKFPYRWRPRPFDGGQWGKLWTVAYDFASFKRFYLADMMSDEVFDNSSEMLRGKCYEDVKTIGTCTLSRMSSWDVEPRWEFNGVGVGRLVGSRRISFWATPDNPVDSTYPSSQGGGPAVEITGIVVDEAEKPFVASNLSDVVSVLTPEALSQPVSSQTLAKLTDAAWRRAAAQPDYQGHPYSAAYPVTAYDATTWTQAHPADAPKLDDLLRPASNPTTYPDGVPISTTVVYVPSTPGTSPGTTPGTTVPNGNVNVINTPNVNVVNTVKVDFGTDPGVADPALENPPTGAQILQPLTSLFPELRSYQTPQHIGACPKPVFDVFGKTIVMDSHCTLAEQNRTALAALMMAVWMLVGLFILLSA
ncbi:hypothetical protein OX459_15780 [Janthinobacterium sp. SUN026]|nr:hypothetical protein [Janthinobacterium sp. SUN026]